MIHQSNVLLAYIINLKYVMYMYCRIEFNYFVYTAPKLYLSNETIII